MDRLTGAEFAARRHLLGLTLDQLAAVLGVNPRTVRAWESGRDLIPPRISLEFVVLIDEHTALVRQMLDADVPVCIPRDGAAPHPRGWHVAAAARAIAVEPDLIVEWLA